MTQQRGQNVCRNTGKPQYKVQLKGSPTEYNQGLLIADIDEDIIQQFWLHGSKTATYKIRMSHNSPHHRKSRRETLDMINKKISRPLTGIAEEEGPQVPQPAEGI